MNKTLRSLGVTAFCLLIQARGEVVFHDTFQAGHDTAPNIDYASRQVSGVTTSIYGLSTDGERVENGHRILDLDSSGETAYTQKVYKPLGGVGSVSWTAGFTGTDLSPYLTNTYEITLDSQFWNGGGTPYDFDTAFAVGILYSAGSATTPMSYASLFGVSLNGTGGGYDIYSRGTLLYHADTGSSITWMERFELKLVVDESASSVQVLVQGINDALATDLGTYTVDFSDYSARRLQMYASQTDNGFDGGGFLEVQTFELDVSISDGGGTGSQIVDEGWRYVLSPAQTVCIKGGAASSQNQSGEPLIVQRLDDADGYSAVLVKYDLTELPLDTSVDSFIQHQVVDFGVGENASLAVYAVENNWNADTVTLDTAPQKIERLTEVTMPVDVDNPIPFFITEYLRSHLADDAVSFLFEMRSAAGFSQPVEFTTEPLLKVVKTQSILYDRKQLLFPVWDGDRVTNETILPTSYSNGLAEANLAFIPSGLVNIKNYGLDTTYTEGVDFTVEGRTIRLTPNSSIPFLHYEELYHNDPDALPGVMPALDGGYLTFSETSFFNDHQLAVTYDHVGDPWVGPVPQSAEAFLPKTFQTLENRDPLKLLVFGDSISVGASASGLRVRAPWMPVWSDLVRDQLEQAYGSQIDCVNASKGGTISEWGKNTVDGLASFERPDLVILGFGMNDGGVPVSADQFAENIRAIMASFRAQNPDVEFILLMSFQPNSRWRSLEPMPEYLVELNAMEGPGVAVVDMWSLHEYLLEHKTYWDMTGNHVNHPNDFIVRVYAQAILARLGVDTSSAGSGFCCTITGK